MKERASAVLQQANVDLQGWHSSPCLTNNLFLVFEKSHGFIMIGLHLCATLELHKKCPPLVMSLSTAKYALGLSIMKTFPDVVDQGLRAEFHSHILKARMQETTNDNTCRAVLAQTAQDRPAFLYRTETHERTHHVSQQCDEKHVMCS